MLSKENLFFTILWIAIIAFVVSSCNKEPVKSIPISIESKYELNILARKYDIPLETANELFLRKGRVKDTQGHNDWKKYIEKKSKETGIPENIIAAFLVDVSLINKDFGNRDENYNE